MYDNEEYYDILFKILIIGDSGVGKSNLLLRFSKNEFMSDMRSTVGVEFGSKMLTIEDFQVKAQIWDTAGQERYRSITSAYYKGAKGVLIVYDVSRRDSFVNVDKWISEFKMKCDEDASIMIIGNKSDLSENRKVSKEEASLKANTNQLAFFETSAKDNDNVELAFMTLIQEIFRKFKMNFDENFITATGKKKERRVNKKKDINGSKGGFNDNGENLRLDIGEDSHDNKMFPNDTKRNICC